MSVAYARPHRRPALLLACLLSLATGLALLGLAQAARPAVHPDESPNATGNVDLAHAFYAAVDAVLAEGDRARLDAVLAPWFAWRTAPPGLSPDADGLATALAALRTVAPGARFITGAATAAGPWVTARVALGGVEGAAFLGMPLSPSLAAPEAFGLLRVEGGRVAEYWGGPSGPILTPLVQTTFPAASPTRRAVTLERWSYAPGVTEVLATNLAVVVLLVDAGTLTVDVAASAVPLRVIGGGTTAGNEREVLPRTSVRLGAGDALVVPQVSRIALRNGGIETAVALVVAAGVPVPRADAEAGPSTTTPGTTHTVLARGPSTTLPAEQTTVAIGRAVLAPGSGLPAHRVGVAELMAVEAGTLVLDADEGAWITEGPGREARHVESGAVPAGGGARADAGTVVEERAGGDAPLVIVAVVLGDGSDPTMATVQIPP